MLKVTLLAAALLVPALGQAQEASTYIPSYGERSAADIINSGYATTVIGRMIAEEGDRRDLGFGDSTVELRMVLRNARGQENERTMRQRVLEVPDTSVGDKSINIFDNPRDVAGTAFLTHTMILDPDDQWLYLPALKRVKRISSKNKSGPFVGSEFAYEDLASQEVAKYTYDYLRSEACPTDAAQQCMVVERYPEYADSGYTKQQVWIDQDHFRVQQINFYDRKEALLKTLTYGDYQQHLEQYWRPQVMQVVNHQNGKSTDLYFADYNFRTGLTDGDFTEGQLRRVR